MMDTDQNSPADAGRLARGVRPLPQPGAWVAQLGGDSEYPQIAKVREAHPYADALDLIFYSSAGERVGRVSPAMGGPTGFEPFCGAEFWVEIQAPRFAEIAEARYGWRELLTPLRPNVANKLPP